MRFRDRLCFLRQNSRRGRLRPGLCVLAVAIAVCSVTLVTLAGNTAAREVALQLERIGLSGTVFYVKGEGFLSTEELESAARTAGTGLAVPFSFQAGTARFRRTRTPAGILGTGEDLPRIFHLTLLHGSFPTRGQVRAGALCAVIEDTLAREAYGRENVVGKTLDLTLDGVTETFTVCGVIRSQSAQLAGLAGASIPHIVYVPYTAVFSMTQGGGGTRQFLTPSLGERASARLTRYLERTLDLTVEHEDLDRYTQQFSRITELLRLVFLVLGMISMVVGGVGVMSCMLSSVDSRVREIGVCMALGARRWDLTRLFLLEAVLICGLGAVCGAAGAWVLVRLTVPQALENGFLPAAAMAVGAAIASGVIFGVVPAVRAGRLDPIDAIRREL